jgi:hypothetical protein
MHTVLAFLFNRACRPKEPQFGDVVIFYNLVFDLGSSLNPTEAARKLLDKEFALSAANYLTDDIEVATRFKQLAQLRSSMQDIAEVHGHLEEKGARGVIRWILSHPIRLYRLFRTVRQEHSSLGENESIEGTDQLEDEDVWSELEGVQDFVDEAMARIQLLEALQRYTDRLLFSPLYIRDIPFARVGLQPFYATVDGERVDVDVGVLIHRTGVAILTFYAVFDKKRTAEELIRLQVATHLQVESSEVVRAIVEPGARAFGLRTHHLDKAPFERKHSSGVEWFIYRDQEGVTLADVFGLYQTAILSAIHEKEPSTPVEPWSWLRTSDWFAYPIVFVRRLVPAIQDGSSFISQYPKTLAGLVQRFPHWQKLKEDHVQEVLKDDLSLSKDYSLYIESSHTTVLYYEPYRQALIEKYGDDVPGQEWIFAELQTSVVIDVLLVQRWILAILDRQLGNLSYNLDKLNALRRELLLALEEYHGITLSYGSAQDIVRQGQDKMGINELYKRIMLKLSGIEKLIETEESRRSARREFLVDVAAVIAALLFGLSGAWGVTEVASKWNQLPLSAWWGLERTILKPIVEFIDSYPVPVTLALYIASVVIVVSIVLWGVRASRKHKRIYVSDQSKPAYAPGFTWPVGVTISHGEQSDESDASAIEATKL